uniref:ER lumen protein-retaining receptor n=1 Tax=Gasterosteus aculeatus aculeatus TaxID=481459 RepID=A0AAQ4QHM3_GASAC
MENQVLCRYFRKESSPVCLGVHHSLPGPAHRLHLALQHQHEGERARTHFLYLNRGLHSDTPVCQRVATRDCHSRRPVPAAASEYPTGNVVWVFQVIYIGCAYATVYLIYLKFKATYDGNHDTFRVEFLVVPVGGLAFLVNHDFSPLEILWTFSIYLESVAILPQLFMISKTGEAETITTHYLFFLGLYRALYLFNWIWRFYFEGFFDMIAIVAGVVQTILYCDFFYLYVTKVLKGKKLSLPA